MQKFANPTVTKSVSIQTLVFIDSAVAERQNLVAGAVAGTEVICLSPARDGVEQITAILAERRGLRAIHIVSHGSPGSLQLGSVRLSLENLDSYANLLQQWRDISFSDISPSVLLYGCEVAAGDRGNSFVHKLSQLTGAKVAASSSKTGSAALGGNWEFEVKTGTIDTQLALTAETLKNYKSILATFSVTNTDDSGAGSLRQAILDANANPGTDTITFNIGSGVQTIQPLSALPTIADSVIIDATTQPGYSGTPLIEIDGTNAAGLDDGVLQITAGNSTVRGLIINRAGFSNAAILLSGGAGNIIENNYFGTDVTGTVAPDGNGSGIVILDSANNTIQNNLISGNDNTSAVGIRIEGVSATGNQILGNFIGTDVTGTADLGNAGSGIVIRNAPNNVIGGTTPDVRNIISGNNFHGVEIVGSTATGNQILGNYIGTDITGSIALRNIFNGVAITDASNNIIGGNAAEARNVISGNGSDGIIFNENSSGNQIIGNYIGTNATGSAALANGGLAGVRIDGANNTIQGNLISGNRADGILIGGSNANGNRAIANLIGTDASGTAALANGEAGIVIAQAAVNNIIGGTAESDRNIISGNNSSGVSLQFNATNNQVLGNFIGTDINGTAALRNEGSGVAILAAPNNIIGGTAPGSRNVISGNQGNGIDLGLASSGTLIAGNYIGTDVTGKIAIANDGDGISTDAFPANNIIGGTAPDARNLISGNRGNGISLDSTNNRVIGNYIGTQSDGSIPLGNGGRGVSISSLIGSNFIGGTAAGESNIIAFNGGDGVAVSGTNNGILSNGIFSNGELGIDLGAPSLLNDEGDGDTGNNNLQNFPVITSAFFDGTSTTIVGTLNSTPNTAFRLEFFANTALDSSGFGEGELFIGFADVTTDGEGNTSFTQTFAIALTPDRFITATATDPNNNTSSFSGGQAVIIPNFSINDITVNEGDAETASAIFTVTLNAALTQTATVDYATADDSATAPPDYAATSGTLTFNPGETTKTITVVINNDAVEESQESFFVNLSNAVNATILDSQGIGAIAANDAVSTPTPTPVPEPAPTPTPTPTITPPPLSPPPLISNPIEEPDCNCPTLNPPNLADSEIGSAFSNLLENNRVGSENDDIIMHSAGGFFNIFGGRGEDKIWGGKDSDRLFGEEESDILSGDLGNDTISGGKGSNVPVGRLLERDGLFGNAGSDLLFGNEGNDTIHAGKDSDRVYGGKDDDLIFGDIGDDTVLGELGSDTLLGNPHDASVLDPNGRDWLFGGAGDDFLDGNQSNDSLSGGEGNDTARGGKEDDIVSGDGGNDLIFGDKGSDTLCGSDGDDTIAGRTGIEESLDSNNEKDCLSGGAGNDYLYANEGEDTLDGDEGDDTLFGGKDSDILAGGDGSDVLSGDMGNDTLIGGSGSDKFVVASGSSTEIIFDFEVGSDLIELTGDLTFEQLSVNPMDGTANVAISSTGEILVSLVGVQASAIGSAAFL